MKPERGAFETSCEQPGDRCVGLAGRAYMATQIMAALIASPRPLSQLGESPPVSIPWEAYAVTSIAATDALLKALNEP